MCEFCIYFPIQIYAATIIVCNIFLALIARIAKKDILTSNSIWMRGANVRGTDAVQLPRPRIPRLWGAEPCPACSSDATKFDYKTGEMVCLRCGLVVY